MAVIRLDGSSTPSPQLKQILKVIEWAIWIGAFAGLVCCLGLLGGCPGWWGPRP